MDDRNDRIAERARRIQAEEGSPQAMNQGEIDPTGLPPEEAETLRANKALKSAARGEAPEERGTPFLRPDLGEIPPAD